MRRNYLRVDPMHTPASRFELPAGRIPAPPSDPTHPPVNARKLNSAVLRRTLSPAPLIVRDWVLIIQTDLSGSMSSGNDVLGLRHEVALVIAEHLARPRRRDGRWFLRCHSFDDGGTSLDIQRTPLDRKHLPQLERALLGATYGGSSNLGPSLETSITEAASWPDTGIIRMVLSDLELFDDDVPGVLDRFAMAPADLNLALVFRSSVPPQLEAGPAIAHHVDPDADTAEDLARLIMDEISKATSSDAQQKSPREPGVRRTERVS